MVWVGVPNLPSRSSVAPDRKKLRQVAFSAHAKARLAERGISLSEQTLARLGTAVDQLAGKGARESLVYLDGTAFVVSVPKRTVITAMDGRTKDNIITNIDSAAIL